ncbi:MAG: GtrA family protein [Erythrobacter sp.]|jgi:putative flippase GtrA|nr:GtrA family protein [Erythrobacter sp.]
MFAPDTPAGRFVRYAFASASGTAIDLTAFALLVWGAAPASIAAATGYAMGTLWHWQVSSRMVFPDRTRERGAGRARQQGLFAASAVLGLALTTLIVTLGVHTGLAPGAAKFAAMCAAFTSVWLVRLMIVFTEQEVEA